MTDPADALEGGNSKTEEVAKIEAKFADDARTEFMSIFGSEEYFSQGGAVQAAHDEVENRPAQCYRLRSLPGFGTNWVVLVAASPTELSVTNEICHMYQQYVQRGVPRSNIVVLAHPGDSSSNGWLQPKDSGHPVKLFHKSTGFARMEGEGPQVSGENCIKWVDYSGHELNDGVECFEVDEATGQRTGKTRACTKKDKWADWATNDMVSAPILRAVLNGDAEAAAARCAARTLDGTGALPAVPADHKCTGRVIRSTVYDNVTLFHSSHSTMTSESGGIFLGNTHGYIEHDLYGLDIAGIAGVGEEEEEEEAAGSERCSGEGEFPGPDGRCDWFPTCDIFSADVLARAKELYTGPPGSDPSERVCPGNPAITAILERLISPTSVALLDGTEIPSYGLCDMLSDRAFKRSAVYVQSQACFSATLWEDEDAARCMNNAKGSIVAVTAAPADMFSAADMTSFALYEGNYKGRGSQQLATYLGSFLMDTSHRAPLGMSLAVQFDYMHQFGKTLSFVKPALPVTGRGYPKFEFQSADPQDFIGPNVDQGPKALEAGLFSAGAYARFWHRGFFEDLQEFGVAGCIAVVKPHVDFALSPTGAEHRVQFGTSLRFPGDTVMTQQLREEMDNVGRSAGSVSEILSDESVSSRWKALLESGDVELINGSVPSGYLRARAEYAREWFLGDFESRMFQHLRDQCIAVIVPRASDETDTLVKDVCSCLGYYSPIREYDPDFQQTFRRQMDVQGHWPLHESFKRARSVSQSVSQLFFFFFFFFFFSFCIYCCPFICTLDTKSNP